MTAHLPDSYNLPAIEAVIAEVESAAEIATMRAELMAQCERIGGLATAGIAEALTRRAIRLGLEAP